MIKKHYLSILLFFAAVLFLSLGSCDPARKYEKAETEAIFIIPPFLAYGLIGDRKMIPSRAVLVYYVNILQSK